MSNRPPHKLSPHIVILNAILLAFAAINVNAGWGHGIVTNRALSVEPTHFQTTDLKLSDSKAAGSAPTLGNYPATTINLSDNATITPDAPPTNTTSMRVETATDFIGGLTADPVTGVVRVTNAGHANIAPGSYAVTVRAFGSNGTTSSKTFNLTVASGTVCSQQTYFTSPSSPATPVGLTPFAIAIGDFNKDGIQDLVTANVNAQSVSIRLGNGLGGFISPAIPEIQFGPHSYIWGVAIGDFNGDGNQDIVVTNQNDFLSASFFIRLGDGNGGFTSPATPEVTTGLAPKAIAVADFNGDGRDDLALANSIGNGPTVSIRLGDGNGGFTSPISPEVAVLWSPNAVVTGDFNNDGFQDFATANDPNLVSIRLGDGNGGFISPATPDILVGSQPRSLAVGDFNGDGNQDLAVADSGTNKVSIRLGDGNGGFTSPANPEILVKPEPRSIAIGDFNNDGNQDFAASGNHDGNVSIRLGDGSGGFTSPLIPEVGDELHTGTVAIGDFDGDGIQDLAAATFPNSISILSGTCNAPTPTNTATPTPIFTPTPSNFNAITAFDAALISRYYYHQETFDTNEYFAADVSGNGVVTLTDMLDLGSYVANDGGPVGNTGTTVAGVLLGDVSGVGAHFEGSPGNPAVSLPVMNAAPGVLTVPVSVADLTGLGAISYEFQVTFDPAILQPTLPAIDTPGTLSANTLVFANANNPGHLIVAGFKNDPHSGSGVLLNLKLNVVGTLGQSTALTFENFTDTDNRNHQSFFFNEGTPSVTTTNGSVTVMAATSTPTSTPTATPTFDPMNVLVSLPMFSGTPGVASVPITVNDVTGKGILSYDLHVHFDPSVITPASPPVENSGTLSHGMSITSNPSDPGHLIIGAFSGSPLTGSGTLLNLRFNIVGTLGQYTYLNFENYDDPNNVSHSKFTFNDGDPVAVTTDGSVLVVPVSWPSATATLPPTATATSTPNSAAISGSVTYGNAIGNPPAPRYVSNVQINAAGSPPVSAVTNSNGGYSLGGLGTGSYTVSLSKNGGTNGAITSFDAAKVSQYVAGVSTLDSTQQLVADVSGNNGVSSLDAAMLAKYVAGGPFTAPGIGSTASWNFLPAARTYQFSGASITGENYDALLMGDVSGNWRELASLRPTLMPNGPERKTSVEAARLVTKRDKEILIPIKVQGAANKGIISYEFDLRYDPSVIQPVGDAADMKGTVSRGLSMVTNAAEPGLLRVVVYGAYPIDKDGVLLNLRFTAVGMAGSVSSLSLERMMFNEGEPRVSTINGRVELF